MTEKLFTGTLNHNQNKTKQTKHAHAIYSNFHGCKNDNLHMKKNVFLIFAQNIDCGYKLEPPQGGGSNEYPQSMF